MKAFKMIILFLMFPVIMVSQDTGTLTGLLTDQYTGAGLFGVKVRAWEQGGMEAGKSLVYVGLSDEDGIFNLELPVGEYFVNFSRYGLEEMEISGIEMLADDTVYLDTALVPREVPVAAVMAKNDQLALEVSWYPSSPSMIEKSIDYGPVSDFITFQEPGCQVAVKFENYYDHIIGGRIFVGDGAFPGPFLSTEFLIRIYDDDGMEGLPGNTIFEDTVTADQYGWVGLDSLDAFTLNDNYYLAMYQLCEAPECAPVGCTQYPANIRSLMKLENYNWVPFPLGNAMIRAWVSAPHESLHVLSYRVCRYSNFDPEGDPQNGTLTELASTNNLYYNDFAWGGMPYGCFAYGIKAIYSNGQSSPVRISNIVCNRPPCSPTFVIDQTDITLTGTCHISLTGETLPFNNYEFLPQIPGTINFSSITTSKYQVSIFKPGYDRIKMDSVELYSDTTINVTLQEIINPITDLKINEFTGVLDWEPEFITQFDWQCPSDSICHELVTPELDLLYYNQWIITVTYRYPVDYDPAYVEYSFDHGRTWAVLYEFPQQDEWTTVDIELPIFSGESESSNVMFQVHDVFGSPYYLDISRVKVWLSDLKTHPENQFITLDQELVGQSDSTFFLLEGLENGQSYLAGVQAEYSTGMTDTAFVEFTYHELFPPENFSFTEENDTLKFSWTEPSGSWDTGRQTGDYPDALIGYILTYSAPNIYLSFEIDDPSKTFFKFEKPDCDTATANLTAVYDLSDYGYPGEPFESASAGPLQITFGEPIEFEFLEDWSVINFAHNCWKTSGNGLAIEAGQGHPGPALIFTNVPEHYETFLTSFPMHIPQSEDAHCYLEFDLNLFAGGQGGYETMEVQVQQVGSTFWNTVQGVSNSMGDLNWYHFKIDLLQFVSYDVFRIRFMFEGIGSEGVQWKVDNIHAYNWCPGPTAILAELTGVNEVSLNWISVANSRSANGFDHYNIFRKFNEDDLFLLATTNDTFYLDYLTQGGRYSYQVNAEYSDGEVNCASPLSDSAWIISTYYISEITDDEMISIYPNPVNDKLNIKSENQIQMLVLYNFSGNEVLRIKNPGFTYNIKMQDFSQGVYFLQVIMTDKIVYKKIVH